MTRFVMNRRSDHRGRVLGQTRSEQPTERLRFLLVGRDEELTMLGRLGRSGTYTLLEAPRRYGKTSLLKAAGRQWREREGGLGVWIEFSAVLTIDQAARDRPRVLPSPAARGPGRGRPTYRRPCSWWRATSFRVCSLSPAWTGCCAPISSTTPSASRACSLVRSHRCPARCSRTAPVHSTARRSRWRSARSRSPAGNVAGRRMARSDGRGWDRRARPQQRRLRGGRSGGATGRVRDLRFSPTAEPSSPNH
jgi:hypothetical protein